MLERGTKYTSPPSVLLGVRLETPTNALPSSAIATPYTLALLDICDVIVGCPVWMNDCVSKK